MLEAKQLKSGEALFKVKRKRIWEIDALRGFCILLMIFDHAMFDFGSLNNWFSNFYQIDNAFFKFINDFAIYNYWSENWRITIRIIVVCAFLFLSGISGIFSKNNVLRFVKLAAAAIVLSLVTIMVDDIANLGVTIIFGILHCLALSVLIYTILKIIGKQYAKYAYFGVGLLLIIYGMTFDFYNIKVYGGDINASQFFEIVLGLKGYGADYFGVFPYTGVFLMGAYAGEVLYSRKTSLVPFLDGKWHKPLTFIGRNTIWVYLFHQPVVLGLVALAAMLVGYRF